MLRRSAIQITISLLFCHGDEISHWEKKSSDLKRGMQRAVVEKAAQKEAEVEMAREKKLIKMSSRHRLTE
jgi:hypothetical protein